MKKAASNQLEDVLKIVCFDICFKFVKNTCENVHFFLVWLQGLSLQLY